MKYLEYLVDTDVCINIIRSKNDSLIRQVCAAEIEQLSVSSITVAELEVGVYKSSKREQASMALARFLKPMKVRDFDVAAAQNYGIIRMALEKSGKVIGPLDMLIAAQALSCGLVLVTNNYREFRRVEGLSTESWYELDCGAKGL